MGEGVMGKGMGVRGRVGGVKRRGTWGWKSEGW